MTPAARTTSRALPALAALTLLTLGACGPREDPATAANTQPGGNAYGQQPYPPGQQPYPQTGPQQPYPQQPYPQQPYPQQPQQPYPQQPQQPPPQAPASPLALPCTSDITCGAHRCNMQTQRCSFPCAASAECNAGFGCMAGVCVPGAP